MTLNLIERRFAEMGARVKVASTSDRDPRWPGRRPRSDQPVLIDVRTDKRGPYFDLRVRDDVSVEVIDVQPKDRHLLLLARNGREKSKFLAGHDERHWFVAAIPEAAPGVTGVRTAKEALLPPEVRTRIAQIHPKKPLSRRNEAYRRQGEWIFTPAPDLDPDPLLVVCNEILTRGRGKPHIMEFAYRSGGETIYQATGGKVYSQAQYNRMSQKERREAGITTALTRDAEVYAKGRISHADHATITLDGWHRVAMNTEQQAVAMRHVMFLD